MGVSKWRSIRFLKQIHTERCLQFDQQVDNVSENQRGNQLLLNKKDQFPKRENDYGYLKKSLITFNFMDPSGKSACVKPLCDRWRSLTSSSL